MLYTWITHHPQVLQSNISNYCLKVVFDDHIEPQMVPKLLLQVSVREINNSLVSDPNYGGLKEARGEEYYTINGDYTLWALLLP